METVSVREFWESSALLEFGSLKRPRKIKRLPYPLYFNSRFDGIFGELTRHKFISYERTGSHIRCENCPYSAKGDEDMCESHMGILTGLLKNHFKINLVCKKIVNEDICNLIFFAL
jgi:hypothetical protein